MELDITKHYKQKVAELTHENIVLTATVEVMQDRIKELELENTQERESE